MALAEEDVHMIIKQVPIFYMSTVLILWKTIIFELIIVYSHSRNPIIFQVLDEVVGASTQYTHKDSVQWNQKAVEQITKKLVAAGKPYKYVVTSSFLQISSGSGLNVSTISYWNKVTDCELTFCIKTLNNKEGNKFITHKVLILKVGIQLIAQKISFSASYMYRWEAKTMLAIVYVFAIAI